MRRRHSEALLLVCLLAACGCSSGRVTVEGKVTCDGQPAQSGTIAFEPADGQRAAVGGPIQNGRYQLSGPNAVPPGKKTVRITAVRKTGRQVEAGPPEPPGTMVEELESRTGTFACEVSASGPNQHDFDLQGRQGP